MPFGNIKNHFRGSFQLSIVTIKKYPPSGNQKFNSLAISQSLKFLYLMGTILQISLKLNFTPNTGTLGCYGLS